MKKWKPKKECKDRVKIDGIWECLHMRAIIAGWGGCLCNKENCYKIKQAISHLQK